jgi:hypothetical protein
VPIKEIFWRLCVMRQENFFLAFITSARKIFSWRLIQAPGKIFPGAKKKQNLSARKD